MNWYGFLVNKFSTKRSLLNMKNPVILGTFLFQIQISYNISNTASLQKTTQILNSHSFLQLSQKFLLKLYFSTKKYSYKFSKSFPIKVNCVFHLSRFKENILASTFYCCFFQEILNTIKNSRNMCTESIQPTPILISKELNSKKKNIKTRLIIFFIQE